MALHGTNRNEVFIELFTLHQWSVNGFIRTLVPNQSDAEDLLQETSLLMWRKFEEFELGTDFAAWACRIAHFKVLNFLKQKRQSRLCFDEDVVAQLAEVRIARAEQHNADQTALADCIRKLSEPDRLLLKSCYTKNQCIKNVAARLGRPVGSVYTSLHRIRQWLLNCVRRPRSQEEGS